MIGPEPSLGMQADPVPYRKKVACYWKRRDERVIFSLVLKPIGPSTRGQSESNHYLYQIGKGNNGESPPKRAAAIG